MTTQTTRTEPLFASFIVLLLDSLAKMVPGIDDAADVQSTRRDIARVLFDAFKPRDALEAMIAADAVAAHWATMDLYARAAPASMSDKAVLSLRGKAIAASRSFIVALRLLEKRQMPLAQVPADIDRPVTSARPAPAARLPEVARRPDPSSQTSAWPKWMARGTPRSSVRDSTSLSTPAPALAAQLAAGGAG